EHGLDIAGILPKPFVPAALRRLLSDEVAPAAGQAAPPAGVAASVAGASTPSQPFRVTEANLRQALQARQFHVVYQPKTRCFDGELSGFEALVRWRHPEQGLIRPDAF